jgi:hypothetical protein
MVLAWAQLKKKKKKAGRGARWRLLGERDKKYVIRYNSTFPHVIHNNHTHSDA